MELNKINLEIPKFDVLFIDGFNTLYKDDMFRILSIFNIPTYVDYQPRVLNMKNKDKIPEIDLKMVSVPVKARSIKTVYKYFLNVNHNTLMTNNIFIYYLYKIWWKIKPPN